MVSKANILLQEPFAFYGQYMQYAPGTANAHLVDPVKERFNLNLVSLKRELYESRIMNESYQEVIDHLTEKSRADALAIERLHNELTDLREQMQQERDRNDAKCKLVYERTFARVKECAGHYKHYRQMSELELSCKEQIIARQSTMLQQMYTELKAVKTMLEIPRFRAELPKYDFRGMDYQYFTETFGQIYTDIAKSLKQQQSYAKVSTEATLKPLGDTSHKTLVGNKVSGLLDSKKHDQTSNTVILQSSVVPEESPKNQSNATLQVQESDAILMQPHHYSQRNFRESSMRAFIRSDQQADAQGDTQGSETKERDALVSLLAKSTMGPAQRERTLQKIVS